ncbi:DUF6272 family protein [Laspinema olomoucense]|uniref:DUF6272 family protein n=1 Tax=Laspinema olomoucense D3b TaxID=2953688 RepID=A0ABT2N9S3_9CYAN|nr:MULTISPECIES: DUF6272 family protein [unclassified Laspinema]MCT7971381.1 DUF6272 family protein [Laspinema sp. D3d]MCT7979450.1 DUF6272 family protein [Laspinema sp. D3b]MCT7987253.1 DUF6272 family protein [Laspinema sp. D3a]MCT7992182.1 DUF6272 family protein [Laspinema sp. D3c]
MKEIIFGDYLHDLPPGHDYLDLGFSANSRPIKNRWRNNLLSAYFVADYLATFLPIDDDDPQAKRRQQDYKGSVSYVANELLENTMKFHSPSDEYPVRFGIHFIEEPEKTIVLMSRNTVTLEAGDRFQAFIQELLSSDPQELYIKRMEENNEDSGLGFLTMIIDYSAKLGWKFEPIPEHPQLFLATTLVQLVL